MGVAPCLKRGCVQVRVLCLMIAEGLVQTVQRADGNIETTPQSSFQVDIPDESRRQARRKRWSENGIAPCHRFPSFLLCRPPGTARATSRRSPVDSRKYMDVLSAV